MGIRWSDMCRILRTVPDLCLCHVLLLWFLLCSHQFNRQLRESLQCARAMGYNDIFRTVGLGPPWKRGGIYPGSWGTGDCPPKGTRGQGKQSHWWQRQTYYENDLRPLVSLEIRGMMGRKGRDIRGKRNCQIDRNCICLGTLALSWNSLWVRTLTPAPDRTLP